MSTYFKDDSTDNEHGSGGFLGKLSLYYQAFSDKLQYFKKPRWIAVAALTMLYAIRIFMTKGYHALTYCLGIHLLNAFIGFISPMEDPEEDGGYEDGGSFLPQKDSEEFRPFQRKIKEFHFWMVVFLSVFIGNILTFFESFDVPVYWPLLLVYFVLIFFLTMRKQINHMMKYKYLPWDAGKVKYGHAVAK